MPDPINVLVTDDTVKAQNVLGLGVVAAAVGSAATDRENFVAALAAATLAQRPLVVPSGTYELDVPIELPRKIQLRGAGRDQTYFNPPNGVDGLRVSDSAVGWSQYANIGGFTVAYPRPQTRADTESGAVTVTGGMSHSVIGELRILNAFHGIECTASGNFLEFQNTWESLRIHDCWIGMTVRGNGSGSYHENIYIAAQGRTSVLRMLDILDFSGEFHRLNIEHANVRDVAINNSIAANVSFNGLHMEGLSFNTAGTTLDGASGTTVYQTSGAGVQSIDNWSIDTCHFGPHIVAPSGMTRDGLTVRVALTLIPISQKYRGGHGIEVGDSIFIEGADTGTSAEYNGAHTVTAVDSTSPGQSWLEFVLSSGTPATPADINTGSDCITVSLGTSVLYAIPLVTGTGAAGTVNINSLHMRDIRITGATAARRLDMIRFSRSGVAMKVNVGNLSLTGQRGTHAFWTERHAVVGVARTSNVATLHFLRPHNLRSDSVLHVTGLTNTALNGVHAGGLTITSAFAVEVASTGSDITLVSDSGLALLRHAQIASVERTGKYATITTTADHGLYNSDSNEGQSGIGLQVSIEADDATYSVTNALILSVPSATTFTVRDEGADSVSAADAGSVQLIENGLNGDLERRDTGAAGGLFRCADFDEYCTVIASGSIATDTVTSQRLHNVQRAVLKSDVVEIVGVNPRDELLNYTGKVYATNQVNIIVSNPTAGSLTPSRAVVRFRVVRG